MKKQAELISQIVAHVLHINAAPGCGATVTIGGRYYPEISVLVIEDGAIEPLMSRTAPLATAADAELTLRRVHRTLDGLVDQLASIAQPHPPGAA